MAVLQVHLLFHGSEKSHQAHWAGFKWTAGRQIDQHCTLAIDDVGNIQHIDLIANTKVPSPQPACALHYTRPQHLHLRTRYEWLA